MLNIPREKLLIVASESYVSIVNLQNPKFPNKAGRNLSLMRIPACILYSQSPSNQIAMAEAEISGSFTFYLRNNNVIMP